MLRVQLGVMDLAEPQDGRQRPPSPADQRRRRLRHAVPIVLVMLALAAAAVLSGREEDLQGIVTAVTLRLDGRYRVAVSPEPDAPTGAATSRDQTLLTVSDAALVTDLLGGIGLEPRSLVGHPMRAWTDGAPGTAAPRATRTVLDFGPPCAGTADACASEGWEPFDTTCDQWIVAGADALFIPHTVAQTPVGSARQTFAEEVPRASGEVLPAPDGERGAASIPKRR